MNKLCVALMGLPARGKSTLAKRIQHGLEQLGSRAAIFNNGALRREVLGGDSASPEFFNPANEEARRQRERLAVMNMEQAKAWLRDEGEVAVIDATHGTLAQRTLLREMLNEHPVLFVECVNEDPLLLDLSMRRKARLPEFSQMSEEFALASFKQRVAYYESVYTPLSHAEPGCWMLTDAVDSRVLDEAPDNNVPYYAAIRDIVSSRWVRNLYLVRHGETSYNLENRLGGNSPLTERGLRQAQKLAEHFQGMRLPYIFTSTMLRSHMTAQPMLAERPACTSLALSEFDEINAGACENMRYTDVRDLMPGEYEARAADKYRYSYPGGESYADLRGRVATGLRRALFLAAEDTLLIVGHQAINRTILSLLLFQRTEDIPYVYIPQNQYFHITITQRRKLFEMIRYE
jgi:broad specificity phosphatase PhoE/predicted kinase